MTNDLHQEIEAIFREVAAIRLDANKTLHGAAERMSKDELIDFQSVLGARLDEMLSERIKRLLEKFECDPVTGLPNRAAFNRRLGGEIERARRYGRELSVALFDIDRFKSVNDRFGHQEGDRLLAGIASLLKSSLRRSDSVFRYGGDEFAAICPETSGPAMAHALRRLESKLPDLSWGVASFPADAAQEDELIRIADDKLYACKRSRRRAQTAVE